MLGAMASFSRCIYVFPLCAANLWGGVLCLGPLGVLCLGLFGGVLCLGLLGGVLCFGPWARANAERTRRIRPRAIIRPASSTSCGAIHGAIAKSLLGMTCCRAGVGKTLLLDATRMRAVDQ